MTTIPVPLDPALRRELDEPHQAALAALRDPDANHLAAITWCSTHLAAVARVLHPAVTRTLPHGHERLHGAIAADHALQQALWWLDRRLTGDARVSAHDVAGLEDDVATALMEHAREEHDLVVELVQHLSPSEQRVLAARLAKAVRRGPTRPHPTAVAHGPMSALAFGLDAGADHLRDLLDSRSWPTPHDAPPARPPGRWGAYLLGVPYRRPPRDRT